MSFRGELREFELPDIMQLISSQRKAGWLKVISKGRCQFVFFRDGKIISTKNPNEDNDPLETYIVKRRILDPHQMDRVAAIRRKTGMDVQDVIQKEGLLGEEDIREIFETMIEEDVFELMSIKSGTYEFETEVRAGPLPEGALCAEIGPILMEAARKADEVGEMRSALGPEDAVLVLTPAGREADSSLEEEKLLLGLVNGVRPVDTLIEESKLDTYTATRILFDIARRGWITLLKPGGARQSTHETVGGEFSWTGAFRWFAPVVLLLFISVLYTHALDSFRGDDPLLGQLLNRSSHLKTMNHQQTVRLAVEVFRVQTGSYPESLESLADSALLPLSAIRDGEEALWAYSRTPSGESYVLLPAPRSAVDEVD
jgi:hypothetical protein